MPPFKLNNTQKRIMEALRDTIAQSARGVRFQQRVQEMKMRQQLQDEDGDTESTGDSADGDSDVDSVESFDQMYRDRTDRRPFDCAFTDQAENMLVLMPLELQQFLQVSLQDLGQIY